jgi:hypothetical protein
VWEKGETEIIDIGHREFLHLFRVSVFSREPQTSETRLYFYNRRRPDIVDEAAIERYAQSLDKKISPLIQSEKAHFPSESETFSKTIRQIIEDAQEA